MRYILVFAMASLLLFISFGCAVNQMTIPDSFSATDVAVGSLLVGGMAASLSSHDNIDGEWLYPEADADTDTADTGTFAGASYSQDNFTISNVSDLIVENINNTTQSKFVGEIKNDNPSDYKLWYEIRYYNVKNELKEIDSAREPMAIRGNQSRPFSVVRDYDPSIHKMEIYQLSNISELEEPQSINIKIYEEDVSNLTLTGKLFNLDESVSNLYVIVGFYDQNGKLLDVQNSLVESLSEDTEATFTVTSLYNFHDYKTSLSYELEFSTADDSSSSTTSTSSKVSGD